LPFDVPAILVGMLLLFDFFIATRLIEFFNDIARGGDAVELSDNCWFVELSDDNDEDESERSEVEPPEWINSVWFRSFSDVL
jgi:hypothetical protein